MIYNKPRDINLRVFPSLSSLAPKKDKKIHTEEAKQKQPKPQKTITENRNIEKNTPDFQTEPIIDITTMPVVDGIPMLKFENTPVENKVISPKEKPQKKIVEPINKSIIDISLMPDIEGIPLLPLPEEIHPLLLKENENALKETEKILKETELLPEVSEKPETTIIPEKTEPTFLPEDKKKNEPTKVKTPKVKVNKKEKEKLLNKRNKPLFLKAASFFLMLYLGTIIAFIIPLRPIYSETEKRNLKEFPDFSVNALLSGSYFNNINTWFSDTFPYRELLTKANSKIKDFYGFDTIAIHGEVETGDEIPDAPMEEEPSEPIAPETQPSKEETTKPVTMPNEEDLHSDNGDPNAQKPDVQVQSLGAIIIADDSGYEYYTFSEELAPRFINSVNKIKSTANCKEAYTMIVPTSIDITLNDALRADIKSANQKKALKYFNASFKNTKVVDGIFDKEKAHKDEYTYFRTDHHWTALGAYYAYEEFAEVKGIKPIPLSKYKTQTFDNFLGTFYTGAGQTSKLAQNPDFVKAYLPFNNVTCHIDEGNGKAFYWDVIKDVSDYGQSLKYITFIGGDNALTTITNADNPDGETCVVIKESFGNAFVPFLIPHYSTIYVIDPRHYNGTLSSFTSDKEIDDVIFLANISTTRNYIYIDAMEEFIQ